MKYDFYEEYDSGIEYAVLDLDKETMESLVKFSKNMGSTHIVIHKPSFLDKLNNMIRILVNK